MEEKWWRKYAVYQIYPRSFKDSNGNGTGDLKGIIEKLDYLEWLGIKIVWLSPIYKSPMADFGYDISDYKDIDPLFGTLDDFKSLIEAMHRKGMYLLMDFVANHTSDKHDWFVKSKKRIDPFTDYYVWKNAKTSKDGTRIPPNSWSSVFEGSAWEWCEERNQYYLHNFLPEQPDLNNCHEIVRQEMLSVLEFWLSLGVDGFRADAVSFLIHDPELKDGDNHLVEQPGTFEVIKEWAQFVRDWGQRNGKKHILFMTEAYAKDEHMKEYYKTGIDWPLNFSLIEVDAARMKHNGPSKFLRTKVEAWLRLLGDNDWWPNWVSANHDQKRMATRLWDSGFSNVSNMLLLLLPGTPTCYYGEELGLMDVEVPRDMLKDPLAFRRGAMESRDPCRSPMPWDGTQSLAGFTTSSASWLPLNEDWKSRNVNTEREVSEKLLKAQPLTLEEESFTSLHNFRRMLELKQSEPVFVNNNGKNIALLESGNESVLMFLRFPEGSGSSDGFLVILNFGTESSRIPGFKLNFGPDFSEVEGQLVFCSTGSTQLPFTLFNIIKKPKSLGREDEGKKISFAHGIWMPKGQGLVFRITTAQGVPTIGVEQHKCSLM